MRGKKSNIIVDAQKYSWKKRPSEIRGYQRAFYLTTDKGDYVRVDYQLKDKRVRLYIELASEGGSPYYSVINEGKITSEKSVSTGRSFAFAGKFQSLADVFSTMPNREIIKLINENYGIGISEDKKLQKQKQLEVIKRRYFKDEYQTGEGAGAGSGSIRIIGDAKLVDLIDMLIGILISASLFLLFQYSFVTMGVASAFFGIIIGLVDIFFRGRSPLFAKVIFFILLGSISYIYGYFYY